MANSENAASAVPGEARMRNESLAGAGAAGSPRRVRRSTSSFYFELLMQS
jgi:hypothetical protein